MLEVVSRGADGASLSGQPVPSYVPPLGDDSIASDVTTETAEPSEGTDAGPTTEAPPADPEQEGEPAAEESSTVASSVTVHRLSTPAEAVETEGTVAVGTPQTALPTTAPPPETAQQTTQPSTATLPTDTEEPAAVVDGAATEPTLAYPEPATEAAVTDLDRVTPVSTDRSVTDAVTLLPERADARAPEPNQHPEQPAELPPQKQAEQMLLTGNHVARSMCILAFINVHILYKG